MDRYLAPVFVTLGTLFNLLVHKRISTEGLNKMLRNTIDIWRYLLAHLHLQALRTRRRHQLVPSLNIVKVPRNLADTFLVHTPHPLVQLLVTSFSVAPGGRTTCPIFYNSKACVQFKFNEIQEIGEPRLKLISCLISLWSTSGRSVKMSNLGGCCIFYVGL